MECNLHLSKVLKTPHYLSTTLTANGGLRTTILFTAIEVTGVVISATPVSKGNNLTLSINPDDWEKLSNHILSCGYDNYRPTYTYKVNIDVNGWLIEQTETFDTLEEAKHFANFYKDRAPSAKRYIVEYCNGKSINGFPYSPVDYVQCLESYVVSNMSATLASDFNHDEVGMCGSGVGDDLIYCKVDINHPAYMQSIADEEFESDMLRMWSIGVTPSYVIR